MALISAEIDKDNPLKSVSGYSAEQTTLDPQTDTVEGRVSQLISKNSDLMKRAQTQGLQQANRRGLLNSSMAVGAAQSAVLDRALPIASQDASTSASIKQANTDATNRASEVTAGNKTMGALEAYRGQLQKEQQTAQQTHETALQRLRGTQSIEQIEKQGLISGQLQSQQGDIQSRLQNEQAQLEEQMRLALQANDIAAQREIQNRQAEIDRELQQLRGSQALEQQAAGGDIESRLINERAQVEKDLQLALQANDLAAQKELLDKRGEIDAQLAELQGDIETRLMRERAQLEEQLQLALQENDLAAQERLLEKRGEIDLRLQAAQGDIQSQLQVQRMDLEKDLQLALQNNDLAARERILGLQHAIDRDLMVLQASENRETLELQNVLDFERQSKLANIEQDYILQRDAILASQTADRDQRLAELEQQRNEQIQAFETGMEQLRQNHETNLNDMRNRHEVIMQSSVNGANIYNSMMTALSAMYQNPDMSPQERQAGANDIIDMANTSLATLNEITGVDNSAIFGAGGGGGNYGGVLDGGSGSGSGGSGSGGGTGNGQPPYGNSGFDINYTNLNIDPNASSVVSGSNVKQLSDQTYNAITNNGATNVPLNVMQAIPVLAAGNLAPIALDAIRTDMIGSLNDAQRAQAMQSLTGFNTQQVQSVNTKHPLNGMGEEEFMHLGFTFNPFRTKQQQQSAANTLINRFGWTQEEVDAYVTGVKFGLIDASISTYYGGGQ